MKAFFNDQSRLRRAIRLAISLVLPSDFQMPIWFGPLRGKKWIVGSFINKCWLGIYEFPKQLKFAKCMFEGATVYDVGANVGYYTLLAAHLVGPSGIVIAFEPSLRNLGYLRKHLEINNIHNVVSVRSAVSNRCGETLFMDGPNHAMGHISDQGTKKVATTTLDHCVIDEGMPIPDVIKLDIEGAEYLALLGSESMIDLFHPMIFLATHDHNVHLSCCSFLELKGYSLEPIDNPDLETSREILAIFRR